MSFVVRMWLEECAPNTGQAEWRGHVTELLSNERRYFMQLTEIVDIIGAFIAGDHPDKESPTHGRLPSSSGG